MSELTYSEAYSDVAFENKLATQISINASDSIQSIQTLFDDNSNSPRHGREGDDTRMYIFALQPGEVIIQVFTWSRDMFNVQGLQFVTNKGRISTRWGCCDGDAVLHQKLKDTGGLASFYALSGFEGQVLKTQSKELWLMSLTPLWTTVPVCYGGRFLQLGVSRGKNHGSVFNDAFGCGNILTAHLVSVNVRSSATIDSIQFTYDNGTVSDAHGGSSNSFAMDVGDFITQIEVRSGDWIDQLQFLTSANKSSKVFGGYGGTPMALRAPTKDIPAGLVGNMGLLGFIGRSGANLEEFQPIWAAMAPISYELISVTYDPPPPDIVLEEKVEPEGNFHLVNTDIIRSDSAQFTKMYSTTYSHTFTDETAASIGAEISFTAGVPEFSEIGAKITASLTQTDTATNGEETTSTWSATIPIDLTVPARSILETRCSTQQAQVADIAWTGKMKAVLYNGQKQIFEVSGTLAGGLTTILQVVYTVTPINPAMIDEVRERAAKKQKRYRLSRL